MSFRLFVYYCALCGGWAALVGWILGHSLTHSMTSTLVSNSLMGMFLGLTVAAALGFIDSLWNYSLGQIGHILTRVGGAVVVGCIGGLLGGLLGQALYSTWTGFFIIAWTLVGFLVGASIAVFDLLNGLRQPKDMPGAIKKFTKCLVGGTIGGMLGGILALLLKIIAAAMFPNKDQNSLWSPTALGFIALGACIGLLVGLAQVILKEAWIKVESGFRAGRELILAKESTVIGRAEGSDIALFGDQGVEKAHARILLDKGRYFLEDSETPGGTFVNDEKIDGRVPLKNGDLIRVGKSVLKFSEKPKKK
jgi:hypothetical protein